MAKKTKPRVVDLNSLFYQRAKLLAALEASEALRATMDSQSEEYAEPVFIDWEVWNRMYELVDNELLKALSDVDRLLAKHRVTK